MQLRAYFDYDTSAIIVLVIPGRLDPNDTGEGDPTVKALSVQIHGSGEILRVPFTVDGERIDKRKGLIAELQQLHVREEAVPHYRNHATCEHCRMLCHSYEGLSCDDDGDGKWPCATMEIVEKYA